MAGGNQFVVFFWFQTFFWNAGTQHIWHMYSHRKEDLTETYHTKGDQQIPGIVTKNL